MTSIRHNIVFEMETSDLDDFMTLLWLADHPDVELLAVHANRQHQTRASPSLST